MFLIYVVHHNVLEDCNMFFRDEASAKQKMFEYLLNLPEYNDVKQYVYVGSLRGYFPWLSKIVEAVELNQVENNTIG